MSKQLFKKKSVKCYDREIRCELRKEKVSWKLYIDNFGYLELQLFGSKIGGPRKTKELFVVRVVVVACYVLS